MPLHHQHTVDLIGNYLQQDSNRRVDKLEKESEAQLESYDKELAALQLQRDKKLISEYNYETKSAAIKEKRVAAEKNVEAAIAREKRKAAELAKTLAIFKASLALAVAIAEENYVGALVAAAELAVIIATPIPAFKKGTKNKREATGTSLVGEEGPELTVLPQGSKVVPASKTKKHRALADAMIDDNVDAFIHENFVKPLMRIEMAKQGKQQNKIKGSFQNIKAESKAIKNLMESQVINTSAHADYNYTIHKSYITPAIVFAQDKTESKKQKSFADTLAKSIVNNSVINNKTNINSPQQILNDFKVANQKFAIKNADDVGKAIAKHIKVEPDYRRF